MGLKDLEGIENGSAATTNPYRAYPHTDWEDTLNEWFTELEQRFPEPIQCDFIEVSTRIKKYNAKAYYRQHPTSQYIRFSEKYLNSSTDERIRMTLLHEMVHLYTYQNGFNRVSDGSHIFKWLCGAVGAPINQVWVKSDKWKDLADPFIE